MKNLIAIALLFVLVNPSLKSQDYALFIHGFQGSDESWSGSGTPDDWVNAGIIDGYALLNYDTDDLTSAAGQASLIQQIATKMGQQDPSGSGDWIIVGHSMGGLVARAGYHELVNNPATAHFNIKAILTVGTPHQGSRATHVSLDSRPGYINVGPVLDEFSDLLLDPINDVHGAVALLTNLFSPDALDQLEDADSLMEVAVNELEYFENASVSDTIKNVIGLNGSLIQDLNSGQMDEPDNVRSVFGSEKKFIVVRAANELKESGNGNELSTINNFDDIRWFYRANANAWDFQEFLYNLQLKFGSAANARRKRDSWNRGRNTLDNVDGYWGEVIDSYYINWVTLPQYVLTECANTDPSEPGQLPDPNTPEFDCWELQYIPTPFALATKNDVIIGPEYAVWNPNEDPDILNGVNYYYDDVPADGGYNHFELRRYKRAYTLPGVFNLGDLAPPMNEAAIWLEDDVFDN